MTEDKPIDPRDMGPADMAARGFTRISRGDAIRRYCVDVCMSGSRHEVLLCANGSCPLFPFRMGTDPFRDPRTLTDEQRAEAAERLRAARERRPGAPDQDAAVRERTEGGSIWD